MQNTTLVFFIHKWNKLQYQLQRKFTHSMYETKNGSDCRLISFSLPLSIQILEFLRSGAPLISRFFRTHVRTRGHAYATSSMRTNISVSVAPRDLIFYTHLFFIVDRYFHKFHQNRPNGYRNRAKNIRTLSREETVQS